MKDLLLATSNQAKVAEISYYLRDVPVRLLTLKDVGITAKAPENEPTFKANAKAKAKFYLTQSGLPSLADDGGIEIDALGGLPGVLSHRWVSKDHDDDDQTLITYLFEQMKGVPPKNRGAQMRVVLALLLPDGQEYIAEGKVRGVVSEKVSPNLTPGFPYRSVLFLPELGKFYDHTELSEEENERYNHRRFALMRIRPHIVQYIVQ
jgi:XTP/dITP diphosphohydrolase